MQSGSHEMSVSLDVSHAVDNAMRLLDEDELCIENITASYDLLVAARPPTDNAASSGTEVKSNDICLLADLYRALLVTCKLLLLSTARRRSANAKNAETQNEFRLDAEARSTILRTSKRCILLLRFLGFVSSTRGPSAEKAFHECEFDDPEWHDRRLPRSRYALLRSFFEGPDRLISLEFGELVDDFQDEADGDCSCREDVFVSEAIDTEEIVKRNEADDDDATDQIMLCLDSRHLEVEEELLLDIALPSSTRRQMTANDRGLEQRDCSQANPLATRQRGGDFDPNEPCAAYAEGRDQQNSEISMEGWLVQAELDSDEDMLQMEGTKKRRYCQLFSAGLLSVGRSESKEPFEISPAGDCFALNRDVACDPIARAGTFHFKVAQLKRADTLNPPQEHKIVNLLFEVDEESGGGLVEGVKWVEAIQDTVRQVALKDEIHSQFQLEWGSEWEEACSVLLLHYNRGKVKVL